MGNQEIAQSMPQNGLNTDFNAYLTNPLNGAQNSLVGGEFQEIEGVLEEMMATIPDETQAKKRKPLPHAFQKGNKMSKGRVKGSKNYQTLFKEVLLALKDDNGRPIKEKDFIKAGIVPLLNSMMKKDSPRYHRLYIAILEMVYGKASQNIDLTTQGEKIIPQITGVRIVKEE